MNLKNFYFLLLGVSVLLTACHKRVQPPVIKPVSKTKTFDFKGNYQPDTTSVLVEITTPQGIMKAELFCNTPQHKENFKALVEKKYYDATLFHRVVSGFMIQGGDPTSRKASPNARLGGGGPEYTIPAEFTEENVHIRGALCAARTGDEVNPQKASSGSQFYIVQGRETSNAQLDQIERSRNFTYTTKQREEYLTFGGAPQLDMEYTVFGRVYDGLDVIDKIAALSVDANSRPKEDVAMTIRLIEK